MGAHARMNRERNKMISKDVIKMGALSDLDGLKDSMIDLSIPEMAKNLKQAQDLAKEMDDEVKKVKAFVEYMRTQLIPEKMDELDVSSLNIKGFGRLTVSGDMRVSVRGGMKEALFDWLDNNGFKGLITETVNSSTLKAFVKEQREKGSEIPGDDLINVHYFSRASVTKAK